VDVVVDVVVDVGVGDDVLGRPTVQPAADSDATRISATIAGVFFIMSFAFGINT
jgi:hypothetical protein